MRVCACASGSGEGCGRQFPSKSAYPVLSSCYVRHVLIYSTRYQVDYFFFFTYINILISHLIIVFRTRKV